MGKYLCKKPAYHFPIAKKGKTRMLMKGNLTKAASSKRAQGKAWKQTPYNRTGNKAPRVDRLKWKRTFQYLSSLNEYDAIQVLKDDGLMPTWEGAVCPFCSQGKVGPLTKRSGGLPRYRCKRWGCQKFITPQHLHPLFTATRGPEGHSLGVQAGMLLLRLANVPLSTIHVVTQINHKAIERMEHNLTLVRKKFVEETQRTMSFGGKGNKWQDVEVDESVFDKKLIPIEEADDPTKVMDWEQWVGMVQRGKPESLVLLRLTPPSLVCTIRTECTGTRECSCVSHTTPRPTKKRSPGPGPIRRDDWKKISDRWLKGKHVILHSDSARAYKLKIPGVVHGSVVHKKRRVQVGKKWVWQQPTYVKIKKVTLPGGRKVTVKIGTQIVDRGWRFVKERLRVNQRAKTGSLRIIAQIRSAQYEYWNRGKDMWLETGSLMRRYMSNIIAQK